VTPPTRAISEGNSGVLSNEERESPRTAHCIKSTASKIFVKKTIKER
jgi:hypothetical protein